MNDSNEDAVVELSTAWEQIEALASVPKPTECSETELLQAVSTLWNHLQRQPPPSTRNDVDTECPALLQKQRSLLAHHLSLASRTLEPNPPCTYNNLPSRWHIRHAIQSIVLKCLEYYWSLPCSTRELGDSEAMDADRLAETLMVNWSTMHRSHATVLRLASRLLHVHQHELHQKLVAHRNRRERSPRPYVFQWQSPRRVEALVSFLVPLVHVRNDALPSAPMLETATSSASLSVYTTYSEEEKKSDDATLLVATRSEQTKPAATNPTELLDALLQFLVDWMSTWDLTRDIRTSDTTSFPFDALVDTAMVGLSHPGTPRIEPVQWRIWESASTLLWHMTVHIPTLVAAHALVWERIETVWTTVVDSTTPNQGLTLNDASLVHASKILRNLSAAIGTLVATVSNRSDRDDTIRLDKTTSNQAWLVPSLVSMLQPPPGLFSSAQTNGSTDIRRRCMRTIRCLATTDWGCVMLLSTAHIGTALVSILRHSDSDHDMDTRILACRTWMDLWPHCVAAAKSQGQSKEATTAMIALGPSLETTLMHMIENADESIDAESADKLVLAASQALTISLRYSPWKRGAQCFSSALFEQIQAVLTERVDQPAYHVGFSEFLVELVQDETKGSETANSTTRVQGITKLLVSNTAFLEIASMLLAPLSFGPDYDVSRSNTVQVLTALVRNDAGNKKPMADDEKLLAALVNVCLMTNNEGRLKDEAKQLIFDLVPEL